jgi:hypothetical protein
MIRTAERVGFVQEGVLRQAAWVTGQYLDEVVFGMLAEEWSAAKSRVGDMGSQEWRRRDEIADEAEMESFPSSDPPAY